MLSVFHSRAKQISYNIFHFVSEIAQNMPFSQALFPPDLMDLDSHPHPPPLWGWKNLEIVTLFAKGK